MKSVCILGIICVVLLTPALASASIASATGNAYVSIYITNCSTSQTDTDWATVAIAHDESVDAGDSHTKHYGEPEPTTPLSYISLESNPLSLNPIVASSTTGTHVYESSLYLNANGFANATMNHCNGVQPISATESTGSALQFKRSNTGSATVTVDYYYGLNLLNAWNGVATGFPSDVAGDLMLEVGLYNSAGQSLLSAQDGWVQQGDILQRLYHVGAGESIGAALTQTTWHLNNLGTTDTYTIFAQTYVGTATYAPEPTTICLLGLGGLGLLRRKRSKA
jgi:hypothetical protein